MENPEVKDKIAELRKYLPEKSREELEEILKYWEEIRNRWDQKKRIFWTNYCKGGKDDFKNLLIYRFGHKEELESKYKYLDKLTGMERERFIEEYLHDDILYSGKIDEVENEWWGGYYNLFHWRAWKIIMRPGAGLSFSFGKPWEDDLKDIVKSLKLKEWVHLMLDDNKIWSKWAQYISKMKLDDLVLLGLSGNDIWDKWAEAISKMDLKDWVTLWLGHNEIWDDWAKAIAKNMKLKEWVCLGLSYNNIWDEWAEAISKLELKEWVALDLCNNNIWDKWVKAIMKNMKLKSGVNLFLQWNNISDEVRDALRKRKKFYEDKWIDCCIHFY